MNNIEHMPDEVFEWMKSIPFDQLSTGQRKTVESFMSSREYTDLSEATAILSQQLVYTSKKASIWKGLLERFDARHRTGKLQLFYSGQFLWKIAAVFLAIGLPLSAYLLIKSNRQLISKQMNGGVDTVYLENSGTSNPLKIYDTVYIMKERHEPYSRKQKQPRVTENPVDEVNVMMQHDINIQSIKDVNAVPNRIKRNAIKDDSLINSFNFITL